MHTGGLEGTNPPSGAFDERILARILGDLPDAVIIIDAQGCLRWANRTAESLAGRSAEDWIGESGLDLVHPDDLEFVLRSLSSVQGKEVGAPIEIRVSTITGWRLMELVGSPVGWAQDGAYCCAFEI